MRLKHLVVVGMVVGGSATLVAQRTPKTFEPSLDAAAKRTRLTLPAPTSAPDLKTTLHKMADVLGMLRGPDEEDGVITMQIGRAHV